MSYACDNCRTDMGESPEYQWPSGEPGKPKTPRHYCSKCWEGDPLPCPDCKQPVLHLTAHHGRFVAAVEDGTLQHRHAQCGAAAAQVDEYEANRTANDTANLAESNHHAAIAGQQQHQTLAEFHKPEAR